jgi:hypothetical protein
VRTARLLAAALAAAGLLASATATPATAAPAAGKADPVLTGRVVDTAGRPVAGATVPISDDTSPLFFLVLPWVCVFTGGVFWAPEVCGPYAVTTRTRADGTFRVTLPRRAPVAQPGLHHFVVKGAAGVQTNTTFGFAGRSQSLPAMTLWSGAFAISFSGGRAHVDTTPPKGATGAIAVRLRSTEPIPAWSLTTDENGDADVDERVFETGTRTVDGTAAGTVAGRKVTWRSASQPVQTRGTPASRGTSCSVYLKGGAVSKLRSCPFTDGRLGTELGLRNALALLPKDVCKWDGDCAAPNSFLVDLGSPRLVRAVVLRNCRCTVELSPDGTTWLDWPLERTEGGADNVVSGPPVPARHVRIRGDVFTSWHLREISVWSDPLLPVPVPVRPAPPRPPATTPPAPAGVTADVAGVAGLLAGAGLP